MIVLTLEISTLIWGLIILARGRLTLSRTHIAEGKPAQWAGFLLLLPLPVGLIATFIYHDALVALRTPASFSTLWPLYAGEAVFTLVCLGVALGIGYFKGVRPLAEEVTWQSWVEVLSVLPLVAGGVALVWFRERIPVISQVMLWVLLVMTALVLWRRGWLKLFGPVLFYDMIRAARRGRYVWMRCIYAGFLLFILSSNYLGTTVNRESREVSARMAESYFETFMLVQLIAVVLLTPAYVAGSIADEKERKTLEFLLATDLRNREIVLSKLLSRLANVTLFILTGLPILSFVQFLGGVDPNLVVAGFGFTAMLMLGLGGLSIFHSTAFRRARDAVAMTYLVVIAYHAVATIFYVGGRISPTPWELMKYPIWFGDAPPTIGTLVDGLNAGNLLAVIFKVGMAGAAGGLATRVPEILFEFGVFHAILATITVGWSVLRLRVIALLQMYGRARRAFRRGALIERPACGELPMLWKEVCVEGGLRFNWTSAIGIALLFVLSLVPFFMILAQYWFIGGAGFNRPWESLQSEMNGWIKGIGMLVGCILILAVAVRASGAISGERDKQTFDALLTTPLTSNSMLWSKWLGSILSVRLGWIWLGFIWLLGVVTGGLHVFALPLVFGAWVVFAGVAAMIGLWFSMVSKSSMRATVWTILTLITLGVGHWLPWMCCMPFMFMGGPDRGVEYLLKFQGGLTPPVVLVFLQFHGAELIRDFRQKELLEMLFFCFFGIFLWAVAGAVFWTTVIAPRFRLITGRVDREPEGIKLLGRGRGGRPAVMEAILIDDERDPRKPS